MHRHNQSTRIRRFGEGLDALEQEWLVQELNSHIEGVRGRPVEPGGFPRPDVPQSFRDD